MSTTIPKVAVCLAALFISTVTPLTVLAQTDHALLQALEWRNIGPFRGGRVPAVAGHPDQPFTTTRARLAVVCGRRLTAA